MSHELTDKQKKALAFFDSRLNSKLITHLISCVHCGLCGTSCAYYITEERPENLPAHKVDIVARIYRRYHTFAGKHFPQLTGAHDLDDELTTEMIDSLFGRCTMCGRCVAHCSIGVDIPFVVRTGRMMLQQMGLVPKSIQSTVDAAINTGNNMAIPKQDFIDTINWLNDDLQFELDDDTVTIPLDKHDVKMLYTVNPREPKFFPLSISAMAKIFYLAKESWTLSTDYYDITNYAYFVGDEEGAKLLTERLINETLKFGADTLVLGECGHGSRAMRWEGPNWLGKPYPVKAITVVELIAQYLREGRIKPDPAKLIKERVTIHDPCNLVRNGGVIDEQRYIISQCCTDFVEMEPHGIDNFCCGGGGGQLAMSEYNDRRLRIGKIKADQITATGAKIVVTPCHNCVDQLSGINLEYKLGVQIKSIAEIVADTL
ncbi:MAG: (Fe-S)-binding protein [Bacteroidales bacterium]|nr:(Fe-S)-binding protein [Bacteroidales bacterium]